MLEKQLDELRRQGYLFHGSAALVHGALEPRLANDSAKDSGNRRAIYLTEVPVEALFFALAGGREVGLLKVHLSYEIDETNDDLRYSLVELGVEHPEALADRGFVYVFDREQADALVDGEWLAYRPIMPKQVLKVHASDLGYPVARLDQV